MSERTYKVIETQGMRHVQYNFTLKGAGAAAMTFVEGDLPGKSTGTYCKIARTSAGLYTITTLDPFLAVVSTDWAYVPAVALSTYTISEIVPIHNSDNTFTHTFTTFVSTVATDVPTTDYVRIQLTYRNSTVLP